MKPSTPKVLTKNLIRALARRLRSEYLWCIEISASIEASKYFSSRNSSTTIASRGLWPRPPPARILNPNLPSRLTATTPRSCIIPCAQSVSQPEKLILNLRGKCWVSGWRKKRSTTVSSTGLISVCSCEQTPARGQAVMLRTVLPQASRVVRPLSARRSIAAGVSFNGI